MRYLLLLLILIPVLLFAADNTTPRGIQYPPIVLYNSTGGVVGSPHTINSGNNIDIIGSGGNLTIGTTLNATFTGNFSLLYSNSTDHLVIQQSNTTGEEWVSGNPTAIVWINDDRTGTTTSEVQEASLYVNTAGGATAYSAYFERQLYCGGDVEIYATLQAVDGGAIYYGTSNDVVWMWDINGAGDDLFTWYARNLAATDTSVIFITSDFTNNNPNGDTAHDNYLSPTFVITNNEGADANDYAAVIMGERTQSNVAAVHYFDFYTMTGAVDNVVSTVTTEIPAAFRIGDSGTATFTRGGSSGDVLFEDDIEVDGTAYFDGAIQSSGIAGYNSAITVKGSDGENCTITFTNGICTSTTCP